MYRMPGKPRSSGKRKMWKRKPRVYKRKYRTNNNLKSLSPIPQRYITKMKYSTTVTTAASVGLHRFRLNSLYDPDLTGIGLQPYGMDQLETLYNRYRVIATSWRIQCVNSVDNLQIGCVPTNQFISPSTFNVLRELPRAKYVIQNSGGNAQTLYGKAYMPSIVGRTKAQYMADDRYQSEVNTNPLESVELTVMLATANGNPPASTQNLQVILEFTVEFFDVKTLAQSS